MLLKSLSLYVLWLTFIPVAVAQAQQPAEELIFPIVVGGVEDRGGHWVTEFTVVNLSNTTARATITIFDDTGAPARFFCDTSSLLPRNPSVAGFGIPPNGLALERSQADLPLFSGYARVSHATSTPVQSTAEIVLLKGPASPCPIGPICTRPSTEKLADVRLGPVKPAKEFRAQTIINSNRHTAVAVVNPSPTSSTRVTLTLFDATGQVTRETTFDLGPGHRIASFLWPLATSCPVGFACPAVIIPPPENFRGSVRLTSATPIAVGTVDVLFPEAKLVNVPAEPGK